MSLDLRILVSLISRVIIFNPWIAHYVIFGMSYVTFLCHMSFFVCHVSYVIFVCHMSFFVCHMSCHFLYVICHVSFLVCHMSYFVLFIFKFLVIYFSSTLVTNDILIEVLFVMLRSLWTFFVLVNLLTDCYFFSKIIPFDILTPIPM